jgi:hypothetical protein
VRGVRRRLLLLLSYMQNFSHQKRLHGNEDGEEINKMRTSRRRLNGHMARSERRPCDGYQRARLERTCTSGQAGATETRRWPGLCAHTGDRPMRAAGMAVGEPVGRCVLLERPARQRDYGRCTRPAMRGRQRLNGGRARVCTWG